MYSTHTQKKKYTHIFLPLSLFSLSSANLYPNSLYSIIRLEPNPNSDLHRQIEPQVERQEECAARAAFRGFDRLARGLLLTLQAAEPSFQPDVARRRGAPWGAHGSDKDGECTQNHGILEKNGGLKQD